MAKADFLINAGTSLNPDLTFARFVEGHGNKLVLTAALQIAEKPGGIYNPLLIYGGVGLGKTHLMQAIGNRIRSTNAQARIVYVHTERYVTDLVRALQNGAIVDFRAAYQAVDVLLVEDVQFLAGKDRSQDEFFQTFNALFDRQLQIVLTCNRHPKLVDGLEDRLASRFGWGLVVGMEPPDMVTCVSILMSKAAMRGVALTQEVAQYLTERVGANARDLEGALHGVIAIAELTGREPSMECARESLRDRPLPDDAAAPMVFRKSVTTSHGHANASPKANSGDWRSDLASGLLTQAEDFASAADVLRANQFVGARPLLTLLARSMEFAFKAFAVKAGATDREMKLKLASDLSDALIHCESLGLQVDLDEESRRAIRHLSYWYQSKSNLLAAIEADGLPSIGLVRADLAKVLTVVFVAIQGRRAT